MTEDPSSPRYQMGIGMAFLAAVALTCGLAVAIQLFF